MTAEFIAELRCSAISSPITPSIEHSSTIPNSNLESGDFLDAHTSLYQPLIQRNSMGNIKWDYGSNAVVRSTSEALQVVTGTKGSLTSCLHPTHVVFFISPRFSLINLTNHPTLCAMVFVDCPCVVNC